MPEVPQSKIVGAYVGDTPVSAMYQGETLIFGQYMKATFNTPGVHNITPPSWAQSAFFILAGGGGAGGGGNSGNYFNGEGGKGGDIVVTVTRHSVSLSNNIVLNVGRGGQRVQEPHSQGGGRGEDTHVATETGWTNRAPGGAGGRGGVEAGNGIQRATTKTVNLSSDWSSSLKLPPGNYTPGTAGDRSSIGEGGGTPGARGGGGGGGNGGLFGNWSRGGNGGDGFIEVHFWGERREF